MKPHCVLQPRSLLKSIRHFHREPLEGLWWPWFLLTVVMNLWEITATAITSSAWVCSIFYFFIFFCSWNSSAGPDSFEDFNVFQQNRNLYSTPWVIFCPRYVSELVWVAWRVIAINIFTLAVVYIGRWEGASLLVVPSAVKHRSTDPSETRVTSIFFVNIS